MRMKPIVLLSDTLHRTLAQGLQSMELAVTCSSSGSRLQCTLLCHQILQAQAKPLILECSTPIAERQAHPTSKQSCTWQAQAKHLSPVRRTPGTLKLRPLSSVPYTMTQPCCPAVVQSNGTKCTAAAPAAVLTTAQPVDEQVRSSVQQYYTDLTSSNDLKTSACTTCKAPSPEVRAYLKDVPQEIKDRYYGCGTPLPLGITGLRVLDLGSGTGRDCYVAARMVGENGYVTGIDMTPEQLKVANQYVQQYTEQVLKYKKPNMRFIQGTIEKLDAVEDNSQDLIISNCVINLSPDKAGVLREVYRVLAPGGEMYFSDIYCDRRLPDELRTHPVLLGECLGGALYTNDFIRLARQAGFTDPRCIETEEVLVTDPALADLLGNARFYSKTYRLFKLPGRLEDLCEDYGQVAVYKGTLPGHKHAYALDDHHKFITNKPMLVCGNTASMVQETWLSKHFTVTGDRSVHYGLFDCSGDASPAAVAAACAPGGACC